MTRLHLVALGLALSAHVAGCASTPTRGGEQDPALQRLVLLGPGSGMAAWTHADGRDGTWVVDEAGVMTVNGTGNLVSRATFGDHRIELEFWCPAVDRSLGIDRGNSGVYVQGIYEVQVLDSYEMPIQDNSCGAIYGISPPAVNASAPPETWQRYRIDLRAARLGPDGALIEPARMSVWHNGILVQDDVEVPRVTPGGLGDAVVATGPLMLQDYGEPVRFRDVVVTPLEARE